MSFFAASITKKRASWTDIRKDKLTLDQWGCIKTDEDMCTNILGVFAVGDVISKKYRQITTVVAYCTIIFIVK